MGIIYSTIYEDFLDCCPAGAGLSQFLQGREGNALNSVTYSGSVWAASSHPRNTDKPGLVPVLFMSGVL